MSATDPGSVASTLKRLRHLSQSDCQPHWHWHLGDLSLGEVVERGADWPLAPVNERQHIAWGRGQQVLWLYQPMVVPEHLHGYALAGLTLRLSLAWWAEDAQIFVNGALAQAGDLFDYFTRLRLAGVVEPGMAYQVAVRLVSPGHDEGALVRSHLLYEVPPQDESSWPSPEPSFVADELAALGHYVQALAPAQTDVIQRATAAIDWAVLNPSSAGTRERTAFHQSLARVRQQLAELGQWVQQRRVSCVGHAHLDMAWLWPVADTWQAAERTFESVLSLQQDFPELTYTHSSPALFAWLEEHRPALFARVQQQVQAGKWSIDAGLWIEPELNIISGESIARQILYGQRYCQEKFGALSTIAWLPDTFGFCHQLPQLLKLGGIEVFATQKLRWNDTTQFPHELFQWRGPDGSTVLGWTLPPIGTDFDPVQIAAYAAQWEAKTGVPQALWLPGVGDHGGGPTREMLETARRWAASPLFPPVTFVRPGDFMGGVKSCFEVGLRGGGMRERQRGGVTQPTGNLPEWEDELYLELHRGCYTTHADQKWYNRRCEDLLYSAEVWCTIARMVAQQPYPQASLEQAWKAMLFNQFHDILPGSAIPEVFDDANRGWQRAQTIATAQLEQALQQLISCIDLPAPPQPDAQPIVVFNALSWDRREVVSVTLPGPTLPGPTLPGLQTSGWKIFDGDGQLISHQLQVFDATDKYLSKINDEKGDTLLDPPGFATPLIKGGLGGIPRTRDTENSSAQLLVLFLAAVPAVGYSVYWRCPSVSELPADRVEGETPTDYRLENDRLRVSICATTGEILSLFDRVYGREVLDGRANQLQAFSDDGQYWDAWNLAPDYESRSYGAAQLEDMQWLERGPLRQCLRVRRRLGRSQITQVYCLEADSPLLKIETEVDWQETQVLLKVNFPTAFQAEVATYEAPFGATVRTTAAPPPGPEQSKEQKLMDQTAEDREGAIAPTPPNSDDYQQAHAKTKWEVPALRWADLTDPDQDYGLSVLTDGKHGFDAKPNQLRLTLLKAPLWPDPSADRGQHRFTYALYPHGGSWQQAETVQRARDLNLPLTVREMPSKVISKAPAKTGVSSPHNNSPRHSFLRLQHAVLAAFKPTEERRDEVMLRCYDATGAGVAPAIETSLELKVAGQLDLLERPIDTIDTPRPYQVWSYGLCPGDSEPPEDVC